MESSMKFKKFLQQWEIKMCERFKNWRDSHSDIERSLIDNYLEKGEW